jgi:hypothetical protein
MPLYIMCNGIICGKRWDGLLVGLASGAAGEAMDRLWFEAIVGRKGPCGNDLPKPRGIDRIGRGGSSWEFDVAPMSLIIDWPHDPGYFPRPWSLLLGDLPWQLARAQEWQRLADLLARRVLGIDTSRLC